jgi:hypothetical protein
MFWNVKEYKDAKEKILTEKKERAWYLPFMAIEENIGTEKIKIFYGKSLNDMLYYVFTEKYFFEVGKLEHDEVRIIKYSLSDVDKIVTTTNMNDRIEVVILMKDKEKFILSNVSDARSELRTEYYEMILQISHFLNNF